jgi:hypothetical protein
MRVFVAPVGVALSVALQCGSCNPTFPLNLSLQVFFFSSGRAISGFQSFFFSLVGEVLHAPPGISVLDVQVLETSRVLAYIIFCCVVLEILCLFSELRCVLALDYAHETSLMCS